MRLIPLRPRPSNRQVISSRACQRGFTLIELITVIILLGILSLAVIPRLSSLTAFSGRGFYDQTRSALRYAQKTAIAQRRWVSVIDQTNGLRLVACRAGAGGDGCTPDAAPVCDLAVIDPATGQAFAITAPSGVSLSHDAAYAGQFQFDCEGRPRGIGGTVVYTVTGDGSLSFTVEVETGYVHP